MAAGWRRRRGRCSLAAAAGSTRWRLPRCVVRRRADVLRVRHRRLDGGVEHAEVDFLAVLLQSRPEAASLFEDAQPDELPVASLPVDLRDSPAAAAAGRRLRVRHRRLDRRAEPAEMDALAVFVKVSLEAAPVHHDAYSLSRSVAQVSCRPSASVTTRSVTRGSVPLPPPPPPPPPLPPRAGSPLPPSPVHVLLVAVIVQHVPQRSLASAGSQRTIVPADGLSPRLPKKRTTRRPIHSWPSACHSSASGTAATCGG